MTLCVSLGSSYRGCPSVRAGHLIQGTALGRLELRWPPTPTSHEASLRFALLLARSWARPGDPASCKIELPEGGPQGAQHSQSWRNCDGSPSFHVRPIFPAILLTKGVEIVVEMISIRTFHWEVGGSTFGVLQRSVWPHEPWVKGKGLEKAKESLPGIVHLLDLIRYGFEPQTFSV